MAFEWLNVFRRRQSGDPGFVDETPTGGGGQDTTSSAARSAQRQRDEREMQDRLDAFMREQKKIDREADKLFDPEGRSEWTDEDKKRAQEAFKEQEAERTAATTPATKKDLEDEIRLLEGSGRLVPDNPVDGKVVGSVGQYPTWVPGLPPAELDGTLVQYSSTLEKWVVIAPPETNALLVRIGSEYKWIEIPAESYKILVTDNTLPGKLKFDYMRWRE